MVKYLPGLYDDIHVGLKPGDRLRYKFGHRWTSVTFVEATTNGRWLECTDDGGGRRAVRPEQVDWGWYDYEQARIERQKAMATKRLVRLMKKQDRENRMGKDVS